VEECRASVHLLGSTLTGTAVPDADDGTSLDAVACDDDFAVESAPVRSDWQCLCSTLTTASGSELLKGTGCSRAFFALFAAATKDAEVEGDVEKG
jgi:hypothetical protein